MRMEGRAMSHRGSRLIGAALACGAAAAVCRVWRARPHVVRTMSGVALVYTTRDASGGRVRVLRTGGVYQSATYLGARRMEPVFEYYRAFGRLFDLRPTARQLLAIGGGGFAFPKLVAAEHPGVRTDVVEIDPAVVHIARRWFYLDDAVALARAGSGDLQVICDDGRRFLEREPGPYDAVVLDAFVGETPVRSLATVEALRLVRRALAPGGLLLTNVVSRADGTDVSFLRSVVATALVAFDHVKVVPATDDSHAAEDNYLLVASDTPIDLPDAIPFDEDFLGDVLFDI
ncbi:MAG TPA: fused MFS/spermidine synthase [Candidatus Olsenella excrementavium]|uniref:Fused MFS/spermidine synthase n=1 Tax=Candidatus Olsenella excrementavium TaxID=2838709 RepID=A0A9D2CGG5_9ACTN|nr:fused MFS/spermidine synthase [Candidatus Olsenella excrementavium]